MYNGDVLSVIRQAARAPALVERAVLEANRLAQDAVKPLESQRNLLKRELEATHKQAQEMLSGLLQSGLLSHATGRGMLEELEQRQEQLKKSVREAEEALAQSWQPELNLEVVREALKGFDGVFQHLSLEEKRELLQALVKEVEVEKEQVKVKRYEGAGVMELVRALKKIARACPGGTLQHFQTEPKALPENAANPSKARPWRAAYNPSPNLPIEVCSDDGLAPPPCNSQNNRDSGSGAGQVGGCSCTEPRALPHRHRALASLAAGPERRSLSFTSRPGPGGRGLPRRCLQGAQEAHSGRTSRLAWINAES